MVAKGFVFYSPKLNPKRTGRKAEISGMIREVRQEEKKPERPQRRAIVKLMRARSNMKWGVSGDIAVEMKS
jgi:hypothetical protein